MSEERDVPFAQPVMYERSVCVIESPFSGYDLAEEFARFCCRKAYDAGYSPWASHIFHPQFLEDDNATERQLGIQMGVALVREPITVWLCIPLDHTEVPSYGMIEGALKHAFRSEKRLLVELLFFEREDDTWKEQDVRGRLL